MVFVITVAANESVEQVKNKVIDKVLTDSDTVRITFLVWCDLDCPKQLVEDLKHVCANVNVVTSNHPALSKISLLLSEMPSYGGETIVVFLSSKTIIAQRRGLVEFLVSKMKEHEVNGEDSNMLTAAGFRVFPHRKCTSAGRLTEGVHWKRYGEACTDREVHIFSDEFCLIPLHILISLSKIQDSNVIHDNCIWSSFLMSHKMTPQVSIWKVKTTDMLLLPSSAAKQIQELAKPEHDFYSLYAQLYDIGWPRGVSTPYSRPIPALPADRSVSKSCLSVWNDGFCGMNMQIHPASELDLEAAAAYGVKVIRIGAVADAKDLTYLLDSESETAEQDEKHLLKVLPRLRAALIKAGSLGLKMIITMVDLPGCNFHSGSSKTFWESNQCRERIVKFWSALAKNLYDLRNIIMGYDIINEPYTIEDTDCDYFDDMPMAHTDILHQFYSNVIQEIRKIDNDIGIIIKGLWYSSPRAFEALQPIKDDNVYYGFHAYIPPLLALARIFNSTDKLTYPGYIRKWANKNDEQVLVDYQTLQKLLIDSVRSWQERHSIPSRQILVAEFGICREIEGAEIYLTDLIRIFSEFEWSWLMFSFRDEEWDALDYELGGDMSNMLHRSPTELFMAIAKHFH